jgi:YHS domain-containing protein
MFKLFVLLFLSTYNIGFCSEDLKKSTKVEAIAVYKCTCADEDWKQEATKVKLCTYCGPAMPQCGVLQRVLAKKGIKYSIHDYVLPNAVCPIDGKESHKSILQKYRGKHIQFCSRKCKRAFSKDPLKYLIKIELKPGLVGLKLPTKEVNESH